MSWLEFHHEAMATTFALFLADQPAEYARQAAAAAWRELDRLENELSRFVESSDIARANRLARGESLTLGDDALQCLLLAAGVTLATNRAFDAAFASAGVSHQPPYTLDPENHILTSRATRLQLDLGAVGKGYALDCLAAVLRDWQIPRACLQSGGSTALALDPPAGATGWPVRLGDGPAHRTLELANLALSGSGTAVKGAHLINPRTGIPAVRADRVWALAPGAALSDALSTAFFVLPDEEIAEFCAAHLEIGAAVATPCGTLTLLGALGRPPAPRRPAVNGEA
jgi:FAD:protein FMN transferase